MDKQKETSAADLGTLADDARALLAATADIAGEHIQQARARLSATLDNGRNTIERLRTGAVGRAKAADDAIRGRPYQAIGVAFGLGVLTGGLLACRCSRGCD
jgi:ElaB/YqjD/DUF883 family membrane-anchored ribosome-binding protein